MNKKSLRTIVSLVTLISLSMLSQIMVYADLSPEPNIVEQVTSSGPGLLLLAVIVIVAVGIVVFIRKKSK